MVGFDGFGVGLLLIGAAVAAVAIAVAMMVVDLQCFREATFLEFVDAELSAGAKAAIMSVFFI